jgi:hypothetical protein
MNAYHVQPIPRGLMAAFVAAHHYAVRVPPHCLLSLGCFVGTDLVGVGVLGLRRAAAAHAGRPKEETVTTTRKRPPARDNAAPPAPCHPPPRGLECRGCGCRDLRVLYTRYRAGSIVRVRACRHCGRRLVTRETAG